MPDRKDLGSLGGETDVESGVFLPVERGEQSWKVKKTASHLQEGRGPGSGEASEVLALCQGLQCHNLK